MDRLEGTGLTVAVLGHAALLGFLSASFLDKDEPPKIEIAPIEVSLSDEIGLETTAPEISQEEMAAKLSPIDAPVEPDTAPPEPDPKPEVAKPEPTPPKPAPVPDAKPQKPQKPTPAKPAAQPSRQPAKPSGGLPDYAKELGQGNKPSESNSTKPPASATGADVASYTAAILRQVQPCANRQVTPGPGAERIRVTVTLKLNRDGSLASDPQITAVDGDDADNSRYVPRVRDLARAVFKGCSPITGLPAALYDVPRGWNTVRLRYKLPG
ncbi:MAG: cell envelope biogenesis protein TolA [Pseudomonadota bacterium]